MRSFWSGSINFGLVSIPIQLFVATKDNALGFDLLHKKDMGKIGYHKYCKTDDEQVKPQDMVKGFEVAKGEYVLITDADLEKVRPEKSSSIDVVAFTDVDEVDSVYFEKPYYVEPSKGGEKAYALFCAALQKSRQVGIANIVIRNKAHLALLKVTTQGVLVINLMRYADEILSTAELKIPSNIKVDDKELKLALYLIDQLSGPFKPEAYHDTYREELMEMIEEKAKGKLHQADQPGESKQPSNVKDIMALLKASLENNDPKPKPVSMQKHVEKKKSQTKKSAGSAKRKA